MKSKQDKKTTKTTKLVTLVQAGAGLSTVLAVVALTGPKLPPYAGD